MTGGLVDGRAGGREGIVYLEPVVKDKLLLPGWVEGVLDPLRSLYLDPGPGHLPIHRVQ